MQCLTASSKHRLLLIVYRLSVTTLMSAAWPGTTGWITKLRMKSSPRMACRSIASRDLSMPHLAISRISSAVIITLKEGNHCSAERHALPLSHHDRCIPNSSNAQGWSTSWRNTMERTSRCWGRVGLALPLYSMWFSRRSTTRSRYFIRSIALTAENPQSPATNLLNRDRHSIRSARRP